MLSAFIRQVVSPDRRLVLLAPPGAELPRAFRNVPTETSGHSDLLEEIQRLRGRTYLQDEAIGPDELTPDGRHVTDEDWRAWHLVTLRHGRVAACVWYLSHDETTRASDLRVNSCALAGMPEWNAPLQQAVESELARARQHHLRYVELGGWAVAEDNRCSGDGLVLALATYSLGRAFGGALGLTTATVRHASSHILRRLGGTSLESEGRPLPAYYDPQYGCDMEVLRFDSRQPNPRYDNVINELQQHLAKAPVMTSPAPSRVAPARPHRAPLTWRPMPARGGAAA